MVSSPSDRPSTTPGPIIINAQLVAAPGRADELEKHLLAVQKYSLSDEEPGCLEYRPARSYVKDGNIVFTVWEKYTGPDAIQAHMEGPVFKELAAAAAKGMIAAPFDIKYFYELS
ncbi:hypothetical protein M422DRAFT_65156 [Sphaerobolus stellatus SS14]|nr:hypothetical protein M422DRAFT_65156 [Sphaerobolus stellatus SS14]